MRRALAAAVVATFALSGCAGSADEPSAPATTEESPVATPSASPDSSASEEPTDAASPSEPDADEPDVKVTISGTEIKPNGKRLKTSTGEPVILAITSDRPAELHVHSTPEQEIGVKRGTSTVRLTVDSPGLVDVEEHDTGIVIVQLEVR